MRLGMSIDVNQLTEIQSIKTLYPLLRHVSVGYESIDPAPIIDWGILKKRRYINLIASIRYKYK